MSWLQHREFLKKIASSHHFQRSFTKQFMQLNLSLNCEIVKLIEENKKLFQNIEMGKDFKSIPKRTEEKEQK